MPAIIESDPEKARLNITRTGLFGIDDLLDSVMRMRSLGMVRMFAGLATPLGMRVGAFRKVEEAERWLDHLSNADAPIDGRRD